MLVATYLYEVYKETIAGATEKQLSALDRQMDALMLWGERHGTEVEDPGWSVQTVVRVFEHEGKPMECPVEQKIWPLEMANKGILKDVDAAIVEAFRMLKKGGWDRPSFVAHGRYFNHIYSSEFDDKWAKNLRGWSGANLVHQRLLSTARIVARYSDTGGEKFGSKNMYDKNWELRGFRYDKKLWRTEMIRRGLIPRKKRGG